MIQSIDNFIEKYFWWGFSILLAFALLSHLDHLPLKFEEPRRGVVALEMEYSGNYLVPTINGQYYYNKPPVYNWILVGLFKLFGSHEDWVLRVPTVISFLLIAFINYVIVKVKLGKNMAVLSSLFFLTSTDLLFYFSFQGEIDMFYSLLVYLQAMSIFWFFEKEDYRALFLISYFLVALGVLTKGLPSIAFQGITLLAFFTYHRRFKQLFNLWHFIGVGVFVGIVTGYFLIYNQQNDALPFITRLISESSNRTAVDKSFFESITHLVTFPLILVDILAPWLLIAPFFITRELRNKAKDQKWIKYIAIFIVSNIILYWISPGVRDRYLYMFVPFFSILFAFFVNQKLSSGDSIPRFANIIMTGTISILVIAMPVIPFVEPVSGVANIQLIAGVLLLGLIGLLLLYWKSDRKKIYIFILTIVVARIGFNFIIMPLRLEDELRDNYKFHVGEMLKITEGQDFFFYGNIENTERRLPFSKKPVAYSELTYHPFQLTYYIEKGRKEIFEYSTEKKPDVFYLSEKVFFETNVEKALILYEFSLDKRKFDFVLFQYLE